MFHILNCGFLKSSKLWSSQLRTQFKQLRKEAWKSQDFNGVWTRWFKKTAVKYMEYFIYHFTSILHGLIRNHKWPAFNVSGFIAQFVRASHRYREVTGSNPVDVLTFAGFFTQLLTDGAYQFKGIFAPVYDYAGNADLNKPYWNPKRKLGVTTHFSKIINE